MGIFGKRGLTPRLRRLAAALCLCAALALSGCQVAPQYEVPSYEQVKADLADQPDIIYPDISRYEESGYLRYLVTLYRADRRIRNGYEIYSYEDPIGPSATGSAFEYFATACLSIEHYRDERNPAEPLDLNMTHRTVAMQLVEFDMTESANGPGSSHRYPDGSRIGKLGVEFDLNGYRYVVQADILLTPDEQETITYAEKMALARTELFVLVDDILDQGGIPR